MLLGPPLSLTELVLPAAADASAVLARPALVRGGAPRPAIVLAELRAMGVAAAGTVAPTPLVGAETLGADVTILRAHSPGTAISAELTSGGIFEAIGQHRPRWAYPSRWLKVMPGRTNLLSDPRTPGGTGWSNTGIAGVGATTGPDGGAASGTTLTETTAASTHRTNPAAIAFAAGTTYTFAALLRAGSRSTAQLIFSATSFSSSAFGNFDLASGVVGTNGGALARHAISGPYAGYYLCEITAPATLTAPSAPIIALANSATAGRNPSYAGSGHTIDLGWAWCVAAAAAGSPLLPAAGAPSVTTRATDVPIWTPARLPRRGCLLLRGIVDTLPAAGPAGLLQLDDGADGNRLVARFPAPGGQPECLVVSGGVTTATLAPGGAVTAGAPFAVLLAWSPGGVRFGTAVGGVASAAVACPAGLLRGLLGHADAAGTLPLNGVLTADLYELWPSPAEAAALLAR